MNGDRPYENEYRADNAVQNIINWLAQRKSVACEHESDEHNRNIHWPVQEFDNPITRCRISSGQQSN